MHFLDKFLEKQQVMASRWKEITYLDANNEVLEIGLEHISLLFRGMER